ncbi:MarR family transcriptional regulator [Parabacteroides sp. PF5-6]|uniref:MarR family winged helix-turn-helix transcriptional regulator n=1 Tax=Parabacteroides sp. PF5-6 TaxID=1742403 RepID=UPI0024057372|nr:MarR family transcriptional regulator [Parabacteroides sp. PF5-6]
MKKLPASLSIALTTKAVNRAFKKRMNGLSLDLPADSFRLLMVIDYKGEVTQQDLADFMNKDKSAIMRLLDVMEEQELVSRSIDEEDKRKNIIGITKKGKVFLKEINLKEKKMFKELGSGITAADMIIFNRVLFQIRENAKLLS